MKTVIVSLICASMIGCASIGFTDLQYTGGAAAAARTALLLIPSTKQDAVKNWMFFFASKLRTLSGDPTPGDLSNLLVNSIPQNVIAAIPELQTIIIPQIVAVYTGLYNQFKTDHGALIRILNDIAVGVEAVAAIP